MTMDLLRFTTAGSVDDGKSTLIGRLLFDSKHVFEDQLDAIRLASARRGRGAVDLSLLTDGLRAEREQGITIDVAYRFFATARRKFIIADTPGHIQYTRNMVTGATTADVAVVLVDARAGALEQTRRHAFISSLLGIQHLVFAINKMDLVDWSEAAYQAIVDELTGWTARLEIRDIVFIPMSALHGDNVVNASAHMPWYAGPPLLYHLEHVHVASDRNLIDCRFPVQLVVRRHGDDGSRYRGLAGRVVSGVFKPGDEVVVLPSGARTTIERIDTADGPLAEAFPPLSVQISLTDDVDVGRGDMLSRPGNQPTQASDFDALVCWMTDEPLEVGGRYALKHTTRSARAVIESVRYRIDVNTLHRELGVDGLRLNEIGRVRVHTSVPLLVDEYRVNRGTGSFILIDERTNATVGAGLVLGSDT